MQSLLILIFGSLFQYYYLSKKRYYFQSSQSSPSHTVGYSGPKIDRMRHYVQAAEQFRVQRTHIDFSNTYQQLGFRKKAVLPISRCFAVHEGFVNHM